MKSLIDTITPRDIETLATRSNLRFGKNIASDGEIKITKDNTYNRIATVQYKNAGVRTAELSVTSKGLRYKCSCSARKDNFCEHLVALSLFMLKTEINPE